MQSDAFQAIIEITTFECVLAILSIVLLMLLWIFIRFRIVYPNDSFAKKNNIRSDAFRGYRYNFLVVPILILSGYYELAIPCVVILIRVAGIPIPYSLPLGFGSWSYNSDLYTNEMHTADSHLIFDSTCQFRSLNLPLLRKTKGLFMSRKKKRSNIMANRELRNQKAALINERDMKWELGKESSDAAKKKALMSAVYLFGPLFILSVLYLAYIPQLDIQGGELVTIENDGLLSILFGKIANGLLIGIALIAFLVMRINIDMLKRIAICRPKYKKLPPPRKSWSKRLTKSSGPKGIPTPSPTLRQNSAATKRVVAPVPVSAPLPPPVAPGAPLPPPPIVPGAPLPPTPPPPNNFG